MKLNPHSFIRNLFLTLALSFFAAVSSWAADLVVYHVDDAEAQATKGLRNIRNHLDVSPSTRVIVVTHANGVDFLMEGAKDKKNPNIDYNALVSDLKGRGVRFEVCEITLKIEISKRSSSAWMWTLFHQGWFASLSCRVENVLLTSSLDPHLHWARSEAVG